MKKYGFGIENTMDSWYHPIMRAAALWLAAVLLLNACGGEEEEARSVFPPEQNCIYAASDGSLYTVLVGSYDASKDYYSADELRAREEENAAEYNAAQPEEAGEELPPVSVTDVSMADGTARVICRYSGGDHLCRFTEETGDTQNHPEFLEVTTVEEGLPTEEVWSSPWTDVRTQAETTQAAVFRQREMRLIHITGTVTVQTEYEIRYYSGSVELADAFTARITGGEAWLVCR